MFNCCAELVIVTLLCVLSDPLPTLKEVVDTCKHAILAEITTLPVGLLTVMPAPGVLLTEVTAASALALKSCVKLSCVF
jgi:hypothetical protein